MELKSVLDNVSGHPETIGHEIKMNQKLIIPTTSKCDRVFFKEMKKHTDILNEEYKAFVASYAVEN